MAVLMSFFTWWSFTMRFIPRSYKSIFMNSVVSWAEYYTAKFGFRFDCRSSESRNILHGSGRYVNKIMLLKKIEKIGEARGGDVTCYIFTVEDAIDTHY